MKQFIDAIRQAIQEENWHAVLALSLTLPDICAYHAYGATLQGSKARYVKWYDQYLLSTYTSTVGSQPHVFLSGDDCYALRCSLMHEGASEITHQRARRALENFIFLSPQPGFTVHRNQINNKLQLQIDIFGNEVADACEMWWDSLTAKQQQINAELLQVHTTIDF